MDFPHDWHRDLISDFVASIQQQRPSRTHGGEALQTHQLIDVMLVLLIMLIITIPVQLHSVNLDMPQAASTQPKKPNVVRIEVDARSVVNWNGQPLADRAALDALLLQAKAQEPQPELHIKAQGKAKYEAVAGVLASAQRQGLTKIGIVGTEQFAAP